MSDVRCPKWGDLGHNWLQGGYAWWRDWRRLRPWRKWRVCTGCGFQQYDNGKVREYPDLTMWEALDPLGIDESRVLTEADLVAALEHIKRLPHTYSPPPPLMSSKRYKDWRQRGWITDDGAIDWRKIAAEATADDDSAASTDG